MYLGRESCRFYICGFFKNLSETRLSSCSYCTDLHLSKTFNMLKETKQIATGTWYRKKAAFLAAVALHNNPSWQCQHESSRSLRTGISQLIYYHLRIGKFASQNLIRFHHRHKQLQPLASIGRGSRKKKKRNPACSMCCCQQTQHKSGQCYTVLDTSAACINIYS